jgi:mRNA-degrading endonuclease RelE of RelBE toxin-antitoxin system
MGKEFTVAFTAEFDDALDKLSAEHQQLVLNKIKILKTNPFYKSLRTKKIKGNYESSVNMDIRIIWQFEGSRIIVLLDVGHHDIIRKYNKHKY